MVVVRVELVNQGLQRGDRPGWLACVQPFLQGLMEPLVLALRRRLSRLPGDGLDAKVDEVVDELAGESATSGVERQAVVREQPLRHAPTADRGRNDLHGRLGRLALGDQSPGLLVCHERREGSDHVVETS